MAATMLSRVCSPRFATRRSPDRKSFGGRIARVAEVMGKPLMPWQQLVADVGGELLDDGRPAFREVWITVPRQSGKTTLVLAWETDRVLNWPSAEPQRVIYSAQNGNEAAKKLITEQGPLLRRSPFRVAVEQVYKGAGNEAITWKNGARIDILRDSESAGHGKTLDLAVADEAFADTDDRREQAFLPAMATRRFAQILGLSTAGTDASLYLKRKVELGRHAVETGADSGIAYFEWAADPGADPDDPDVWWSCMPALGHTIDEDVVRHARRTMSDGDFRRAFLNQWTAVEDQAIPVEAWQAVVGDDVNLNDRLTFAVDCNPERSWSSIVAVDSSGAVEVIEHQPGTGWVAGRAAELASRWRAEFAVDASGPAGSLIPDLERAGVRVTALGSGDLVKACGLFFDRVVAGQVRVRRHNALTAAVGGAKKKSTGDAWRWDRRGPDVDVSPLVAATVGLWMVASRNQATPGFVSLDDFFDEE